MPRIEQQRYELQAELSLLFGLTGPWAFGMTRAAMRRSTAVQPLVAVNGRFLADELELATLNCQSAFFDERQQCSGSGHTYCWSPFDL